MSASISRRASRRVSPVLLVPLAVATAGDGHVHRVAERTVQRAGVLRRVGEDGDVGEPILVEGPTDPGDLPVHHPARGDDVGPGPGLGERGLGVDLQGGVVVDLTPVVEDAAVAVIGVLVDAQIGDQHEIVTDLGAQVAERHLDDALRVERRTAGGVLRRRQTEQHHRPDAETGQLGDLLAEALPAVLDHAGQRPDRLWLADVLANEERGDEIARAHGRLGDQVAQRRRPAQPAGPAGRERRGHGRSPLQCERVSASERAAINGLRGRGTQ